MGRDNRHVAMATHSIVDPLYCDVSLRRLRSVCGLQAVLQATGQKFEDVTAQRQEVLAPS